MKFAILIVFFLNYLNVQTSLLNIEELNSVHYNIDIVNSPVLKDQVCLVCNYFLFFKRLPLNLTNYKSDETYFN